MLIHVNKGRRSEERAVVVGQLARQGAVSECPINFAYLIYLKPDVGDEPFVELLLFCCEISLIFYSLPELI